MMAIIGTSIMFLAFVFIAIFMLLNERRKQRYKTTLQSLEIDNQKKLLEALIEAQENEKQYFAEELHDSIGQLLSVINMNVSNIKRLMVSNQLDNKDMEKLIDVTQDLTKSTIQEVRNITHKLLPVILNDFGLVAALNDLISKANEVKKHHISFRNDFGSIRLDKETEKALFRITQELLNNTIKYAEAKNIYIALQYENELPVYTYEDNGIGFDLKSVSGTGVGLKSIESRVNKIGGNLKINSEINRGTTVQITLAKIWT